MLTIWPESWCWFTLSYGTCMSFLKDSQVPSHHQVHLFWLHPTSHPGLLLLLSLPAECYQDGSSLANFPSAPSVYKKSCIFSMPLFPPCSHYFLPAEIDRKGNQPMGLKQTAIRGMRCPSCPLVDTPNLYLEPRPPISWFTAAMCRVYGKVKRHP